MTRLFIAEKPQLAQAVVAGLGGSFSRKDGYYTNGSDMVTWCFGHLLQLQAPEEYDPKYKRWVLDDLPFCFIPWQKKPAAKNGAHVKLIGKLIKESSSIVNVGDPDDEGQLLIDELLSYFKNRKPVQRLLINDNNLKVVQKAIATMQPNSQFEKLGHRAEARSVADFLYGLNLTRAYTLQGQQKGHQGVLSVGRVQTPILGLVVRRDRIRSSHQKALYYVVEADFSFADRQQPDHITAFTAKYKVQENDPVDDAKRINDQLFAENVAMSCRKKKATLLNVATAEKTTAPPLPYNLIKLQADAARKFGFDLNYTLGITQSLREKHKLITYNRSDCQYLSDEQHADAALVLAAVKATAPLFTATVGHTQTSLKSRAFNSKKVSVHHAIVPTEAQADFTSLSNDEQKIYLLIARAYIAQFYPNYVYDQTKIEVGVDHHVFQTTVNVMKQEGWKALYRNDKDNPELSDDEQEQLDLRHLQAQESGICTDSRSIQKETQPPKAYTMDTLALDLTSVAKYVKNPELRQILKDKDKGKEGEHGGIGTPATRHTILETLFERGYLTKDGKQVISTALGQQFYDQLPDLAKYPDLTALWHQQQLEIETHDDVIRFINEINRTIEHEVSRIKSSPSIIEVGIHQCPTCSKPLRRISGSKGFFWGCTAYKDGCKFSCSDEKGQPVLDPAATPSKPTVKRRKKMSF